jgi:hypothetical protein
MSPRRQVKFVTFASGSFIPNQNALNKSALRNGGATECVPWTPSELHETEFYRAHRDILDTRRGCGYWLWKPYIICRELERVRTGDFVVYYDVGQPWLPHHRVSRPLAPLLDWCERHNSGLLPGVYIPEDGPSRKWTKHECFVLMGCDAPAYWEHPQIQATFSVWQKSPQSQRLLDEWLQWCTTPGAITDEIVLPHVRDLPGFIDHRHDQSILTNVVIKHGVKCHGDPWVALPGSKDINNLIDRIQGRELSVALRSRTRLQQARIYARYYKLKQIVATRLRSQVGA